MANPDLNLENGLQLTSPEHSKFQSLLNILNGCEEFVLNGDGIIISSNLEAVTITGYEEWEIIGKHISFFYPEEEKNKASQDLEKTAKLGKYISSGFRIKKRGAQFWAKMKFYTLYDTEGGNSTTTGFKVVLFDTTHRAAYTLNTRIIKDEYLSLFNNSFIGIFKCSVKNFTFLMLNDKAEQIIRKQRNDLKLFDIFYFEEDYQFFINTLTQEKVVEDYEFRLNDDIEERYVTISCKWFALGGFIEGVIGDSTEKRKQLIEYERVNQKLKNLNYELDNFLYHASHDIRAPLATVLGLINLIKQEHSMQRIMECTNKISERVLHLDSLLKDLSAVAYNNSQPLVIEECNISKILKDAIRPFEKEFQFIKVHQVTNITSSFNSDVFRLAVILHNVISNAFKYYNPHAADPMVRIKTIINEEGLFMQIEDNGRGIHQKHIKDVFKLFFKMDSRGTGSGLGLYVVKIMLDKLGGNIVVSSRVGVGTEVTITIPNQIKKISNHE